MLGRLLQEVPLACPLGRESRGFLVHQLWQLPGSRGSVRAPTLTAPGPSDITNMLLRNIMSERHLC